MILQWLQELDIQTQQVRKGRYRLLLDGGHGSNIRLELLHYCLEHTINPFCLPPHILQP
jgi:hypothetical protein